jgi:hypothetical protein
MERVSDPVLSAGIAIIADEVHSPAPIIEDTTSVEPAAEPVVVPATKPKAKKKVKAVKKVAKQVTKKKVTKKVVVKETKRGRGRPKVYTAAQEKYIAQLIKKVGNATNARKILHAKRGKLADQRNKTIFPKPIGISMPTLLKIAAANGVELQLGRPKLAA